MKRRRTLKRADWNAALSGIKELAAKRLLGPVAVIIAIAAAAVMTNVFLRRSDYFRLKSVEVSGPVEQRIAAISGEVTRSYRNRSIFDVNLKRLSRELHAKCPDAKEVVVRRAFPDKLVVQVNFRRPVAVLGGTRPYFVDNDSFVFSGLDARPLKDLPVISGIDLRPDEKAGRVPCGSANMKLALELLRAVMRSSFLGRYRLSAIDAGDIRNLSFYLNESLEIRIGGEDFVQRLKELERTLKDPRLAIDKVKYIDLRFKEVIIGPK
jgi:cell division protein FtsQ